MPPFCSSEQAGSRCGDPPLRHTTPGGAASTTQNRRMPRTPVRLGGRAGNCASPGPILHPCSHLHAPCMLPSFACALCQSRHQRPGRGRLSVGHHSTAGAPAGRKPLKSRKARRLLHCPDEAAPPSMQGVIPGCNCAGHAPAGAEKFKKLVTDRKLHYFDRSRYLNHRLQVMEAWL